MNGTPKSHSALIQACFYCTHPDLDGADRALLGFLASAGEYKVATNSRPGNANLEVALDMKKRAIQRRAALLVERGLLEITERGDGRGNATVYRILITSQYFPDRAPGGNRELLIEEPRRVDDADCELKTASLEERGLAETASRGTGNRVADPSKPRRTEPETASSRERHNNYSPKEQQLPTSNHRAREEKTASLDGWEDWLFKTATTEIGRPSSREESELKAIAVREVNGLEFLKRAVRTFIDRPQGFAGLKKISPWRLFLKDADVFVKQAKAECMASHDWRYAHDPEYKRFQDESIARQIQENMDRKRGPQQNETILEELMADE